MEGTLAGIQERLAAQQADPTITDAIEEAPQEAPPARPLELPAWLTAKTGDGPISAYIDNPLNFSASPGLAQVIRGLSGMFGAMDYAIIDVVMGSMRWAKERRPVDESAAAGVKA